MEHGADASSASELAPGTVIKGRYRIERRLGSGGFGATYRAIDLERFDAPCAIKQLHPHTAHPERAQELFEREARVLASLSHPLIPRLHHYFLEKGDFFLVEDLVEGETWNRILARRGPIPEGEVAGIAADVLNVLSYLHARTPAVIHRDIKPANIIRRSSDGRTLLLDFGAVREVLDDNPGTVIGTPGFAPPEQAHGLPTTNSDLYALGATLVNLLTRRPPESFHDIMNGNLRLTGQVPASDEFLGVVSRLFADPDKRFPSANAAADALTTVSGGATVLVGGEDNAASTVLLFKGAPRTGAPVSIAGDPPQGMSVAKKLMIAAAVVTVAGFGAIAFLSKDNANETAPPASVGQTDRPVTPSAPPMWMQSRGRAAAGQQLVLVHPSNWIAVSGPASEPEPLGEVAIARIGTLMFRLPDNRGIIAVGLESLSNPQLPADAFLADWTSRAFGSRAKADLAQRVGEEVYQAVLREPAGGKAVGFVHLAVTRTATGTSILWRSFVGDAQREESSVRVAFDSLVVVGG